MRERNEVEVRLIDVLEAFACTPLTPGDEGVIDLLARTGASISKRLDAMWLANREGMLSAIEIGASYDLETCSELSALGIETLEKLRFDERTRLASLVARDILGDIEKEMADME